MELNSTAVRIAVKLVKNAEGCNLVAYPDSASPLYKALSTHGMLAKYMNGSLQFKDLPDNFKALSGAPWSAMYGETLDVKCGDVYTQAQADTKLEQRVRSFMEEAINASPKLASMSAEKIAAVTSLCYNVGLGNYKTSTVAKKIAEGDMRGAADAFLMWNKAQGKIMQGLVNRRELERNLFLSV